MDIALAVASIVGGLVLLVKGSDFFIDGAAEIAKRLGVSEIIIGLTLVAFGTSLPEWIASIISTLRNPSDVACIANATCHITDLALGNVVGSNITNIGFVIGLVGLLSPHGLRVAPIFLHRDMPLLVIISVMAMYMGLNDNSVSQPEGILLMGIFLATLYRMLTQNNASTDQQEEPDDTEEEREDDGGSDLETASIFKLYAITIGGLVALLVGSNFLVEGASSLALLMGITEKVIGVTLVAFGTSVPELATSIAAGKKGKHGMLLGGVIGSNTANLAIILGSVATLVPVSVGLEYIRFEMGIMMANVLLLWVCMLQGKIERWQALVLLLGYFVFTITLFV